MGKLNNKLKEVNQTSEGFYPSLFDVDYEFRGLGELPKIMKSLTTQIYISPKMSIMGIDMLDNKIDVNFQIDTTSSDFAELLDFLFKLKNKKEEEQEVLGHITINYYSKNGTIFYKRIIKDVKFNKKENTFDIFDSLRFDAEPIKELEVNFTFEKIEYYI